LRRLARHESAVCAVGLAGDGKNLFSLALRPDNTAESLQAAAIAPDGTALLARGGSIEVAAAAR
jgi:hypothetical protein